MFRSAARSVKRSTYHNVGGLRSLIASKDHVYLTWHDIDFTVPNKVIKPKDVNNDSQKLTTTDIRQSHID